MTEFFSKLYGNRETKARLGNAIVRDALPHAFLIVGPAGSGRHTLVTELAAALNCESRGANAAALPCHRCRTCRRIADGQFTDVKRLEKPTGKMTIGVDEIRKIRDDMFLSATESDYKVYVIEQAETMTVQAQNALLKVLEEPPGRVLLFLLAETVAPILITVKSRVQLIRMERFSAEETERYLIDTDANAESLSRTAPALLRAACMGADGVIGAAKQRLDIGAAEEERKRRDLVLRLVSLSVVKTDYGSLHAAVSAMPQKRAELLDLFGLSIRALRDLIALKRDADAPLLCFFDRDEPHRMAGGVSLKRLLSLYDVYLAAQDKVLKNGNVTLILSCLANDICTL